MVPAAASYGVPTVVRAESTERIRAGRLLDLGATGVMFPRIDGPEDAAAAISHLRYPPLGDRGVATYNRMCHYGLDPAAVDRSDDEVLGVVQIETAEALATVEEIAALDGVDVLFVGPRDLSLALGVPGDLTAPVYLEALERVLAAARQSGKAAGVLVPNGAAAARHDRGRLAVPRHRVGHHHPRQRGRRRAGPSGATRMTTLSRTDVVVALGEVESGLVHDHLPAGATFVANPTVDDLQRRHRCDRPRGCARRQRLPRPDAAAEGGGAHRCGRRPRRRRRGHPTRHRRGGDPGRRHQRRRRRHPGDDPAPGEAVAGRHRLRRRGALGRARPDLHGRSRGSHHRHRRLRPHRPPGGAPGPRLRHDGPRSRSVRDGERPGPGQPGGAVVAVPT